MHWRILVVVTVYLHALVDFFYWVSLFSKQWLLQNSYTVLSEYKMQNLMSKKKRGIISGKTNTTRQKRMDCTVETFPAVCHWNMMTLLTLQENAHMNVDTTYKVICCIAIVHAQLLTYTFHNSELSYQFHIILWQSTYFLSYRYTTG